MFFLRHQPFQKMHKKTLKNKMEVQDPKMMKVINIELREILGPIKINNTMLN